MDFHSTCKQNGRHILKIELDTKGVEEFERVVEGGLDSTLYLFSHGSFKLTANPRFGSSGAARSAGAVGAVAAVTEQGPSTSNSDSGTDVDKDAQVLSRGASASSGTVPSVTVTPA